MSSAEGGERLSQDELAVVLRRAAELERDETAGLDPGLSVAAVEAAAAEVGLAPDAVRQAVAELRAGMLPSTADDAPELGRGVVVVARLVPHGLDHAIAEADAFLTGRVFERVRDHGWARLYRRRGDTVAKLQKAFDFAGRTKKLNAVNQIEVRAVAVQGGTLLRLTAHLNPGLIAAPKIAGGLVGVTTAGVLAAGLVAGFEPDVVMAAVGTAAGAGFGGGAWGLARAGVERERARVTEVLDGFLDDLALGRHPQHQSMVDKLRRQLPPQFRGGWRA